MLLEDDPFSFGRWLKERRQAIDLTQRELAALAGCSVQMVRKLEAGERRPSKQVAELLARHLEIEPEEEAAFLRFARDTATGRTRSAHDLPQIPVGRVQSPPLHAPSAAEDDSRISDILTRSETRTNLPASVTSFIGRGAEVARVRALLWRVDVRILTLLGPPGIGKTRLAMEVASALAHDFTDGVFFVPLATVTDPALMVSTIARTPGAPWIITEAAGRSLLESLKEALRSKNLLLVLDNFEQVIDAAPAVAEILAAAPRVKVMSTSRAPLHIYGEHEYMVPPLSVPQNVVAPDQVAEYEAVQLFVKRAQAVQPDFVLNEENAATVAEITRRVEGLALAIELAAARTKFLQLPTLLARLESRLELLTGGASDLPDRQRTLRGAIEWSYDLLTEDEQILFRCMSVFAGGCTWEAVQAVSPVREGSVGGRADGASSLIDKSLLRTEVVGGDTRYSMLETIREYALEKLRASGEEVRTRQQHAEYYLGFAEAAKVKLESTDQVEWLERLEIEHSNMRAALDWCLDPSAGEDGKDARHAVGLRLAIALSRLWFIHGYLGEGRRWLAAALEMNGVGGGSDGSDQVGPGRKGAQYSNDNAPLLIEALIQASKLAESQSDFEQSRRLSMKSLELAKAVGDKANIAASLLRIGGAAVFQDDAEEAETLLSESLALSRELDDTPGMANALTWLGILAGSRDDYLAAREFLEESLILNRHLGKKNAIATNLGNLGLAMLLLGDYSVARSLLKESLDLAWELGDKASAAYALNNLGVAAYRQGEFGAARDYYNESLSLLLELGDTRLVVESLEGLAKVFVAVGQHASALLIFTAAEAIRGSIGTALGAMDEISYDSALAMARSHLTAAEQRSAEVRGCTMTLEQVVAFALEQEISN